MKLFVCALLLFLVGFNTELARKIDPESFDIEYLEQLIFEKINRLRITQHRQPIQHDSLLHLSARHQSNYMAKKNKLSHNQLDDTTMLNPQKRAEYFGVKNYYVAENILYTHYNSRVKTAEKKYYDTHTYEALAEAVVFAWQSSSGHFQNMTDPNYSVCGLAVALRKQDKRVFVCQNFGQKK